MKIAALLLGPTLGAFSFCAIGAAPLSDVELVKQLTYTALHLADWQQTRRIAQSAAVGGPWIELNPILGPRPRQPEVNRYMAATLAAHWAITWAMPREYRKPWLDGTIALEASVVHRNYRLGVSMAF